MRYRLAVLLALAAAVAGAALGAATPVSPLPGARVTTSSPKFSWTLPANEQAKGVFISDSPDVTPAGGFFDEDVVAAGNFVTDVHTWTPSSPLYAGHYWWSVLSSDVPTPHSRYSTPIDFTIPVSLSVLPVKTVRSTYLHLLAFKVAGGRTPRQSSFDSSCSGATGSSGGRPRPTRMSWARSAQERRLVPAQRDQAGRAPHASGDPARKGRAGRRASSPCARPTTRLTGRLREPSTWAGCDNLREDDRGRPAPVESWQNPRETRPLRATTAT